ncbi:MAG: LysR family transcriptional regulator [Kofleriaceae bacterium]|nr:LysR family transcriptional regulator [Kofleriaceae bacterium]MCB9573633.1 LysR family transcriptional regulator [Kofleriaceae bacterium]
MTLPPIQLVYAFEAAARRGSFKHAAAELHVTPSAVSQQIRSLEDHLGVPLFHRLPRAVRLTEHGVDFFRVATDTIACYRRGAEAFVAARARRALRVSMLPFVAYEVVLPELHTFRRAHPDLDLRLETSLALADIAGGEADAGVRLGRGAWPGLAATVLTDVTASLVCAPALVDGRGALRAAAIRDGQLLTVPSFAKVGVRARLEAAGLGALLPARDLVLDSFLATMRAAEQGLGVAVGLFPLVAPWIRGGRLVAPLDVRFPLPDRYHFVCRKADRARPELVGLRRWLRDRFAALA